MGKKIFLPILVLTVGALVGTFLIVNRGKSPEPQDPNIISRTGVHWHIELKVFAKGQEIRVPSNIGISSSEMEEIHTHADVPKIHYEMTTVPVTQDRVRLAAFFNTWGQLFEGTSTVTVNGQLSNEGLDYVVKDGDKIEVRYE